MLPLTRSFSGLHREGEDVERNPPPLGPLGPPLRSEEHPSGDPWHVTLLRPPLNATSKVLYSSEIGSCYEFRQVSVTHKLLVVGGC